MPAVWICNQLDGIDPAHVRRFDLVMEMPVPPLQAREKMLATRLGGLKVGGGLLRSLAANVHLAPGHIDKAAKVADYCQPRTPADTGKILKTVIGNVHKALNLRQRQGFGQPLDPSYSLAHVNADHDLEGLVTCCQRTAAVRLLLHGVPGTGKTAFVQYLGHVLGRPVLLKTGSDLLRPYVGQTEKEIATMFREAENQAAILFVDEIDGFFHSRERAHHSWEVTHVMRNSMTSCSLLHMQVERRNGPTEKDYALLAAAADKYENNPEYLLKIIVGKSCYAQKLP